MLYAAFRFACFGLLLPVLLFNITLSRTAEAQLSGKIAEKPIAVGYARNITQKRLFDYVVSLTERLDFASTMRSMFSQEGVRNQLEGAQPQVDDPVAGVAWYMVTGLIPSFENVTFQMVADEADARRLLDATKNNFGENGYVEDLGDGCFKTGFRFSSESELPKGFDESQLASDNNSSNRGWKSEQKIIEKDGKKFLQHNQSNTEYCRIFDNVLYKSNFEELHTMELPSATNITSNVNGSYDLGYDAYLDRIPIGIRQLGWNMLSAAIGTQLQQRDDEPEKQYNMRRSSGDLGLALAKSVLFDIDNSSGWLRFASADDDSVRGELRIRARNNSELTKLLPGAVGASQFAPILNDNAAATIHLCFRFPKEAPAALLATGAWLQDTIDQEANGQAEMKDVGRVLSETLAGIADHRNLELLAKIGWSETSGGVVYGGLQISDNPELLKSLHHFLIHSNDNPANDGKMIVLTEDDGRSIIQISVPEDAVEQLATESGMQITHLYLIHEGSRLWFAAGAENAKEIIRQSIDRCNSGGLAYRTPLLTVKIDMERWLAYPQEDASGIAPLPFWLDENAWWFPPSPISFSMGTMNQQTEKPTPVMQRVFDLGGSQQGSLTVIADEGGVLIQAAIGEALANHMLARFIDLQEGSMKRQQNAAMEAQRKAMEAAKSSTPTPAPSK